MATHVKRIEKDFLLKALYDDQISVMHIKGQTQYILMVEKPPKDQIFFKADRPIPGLRIHKKLDLMFDYRGQVIIFSTEVIDFKNEYITTSTPEFLYKNLDRSFSRVTTPRDLQIQFTFHGDRYSLSYPKITEFERDDTEVFFQNWDPRNLSELIDQIAVWVKSFASSYKLVIFRDTKPSGIEERLIAETGKSFYLPSTQGSLPKDDPYPKKRLITEDIFKRFLESTGVDLKFIDETYSRLIEQKFKSGILSDLWVPVIFHEYVIGYIHLWIDKKGMYPFDYAVIESLYQFTKVLSYSLKINGYFEDGKLKNNPFEGKIIDISASGLLFTYPNSSFSSTLLLDSELVVKLITERRTVNTKAKIVRRYRDNTQGYFGCRFMELEPEDLRFLFECIYGKPFTDSDLAFLSGQV